MLKQLQKNQYQMLEGLLSDLPLECVFAHAILESTIPGQVYVDDIPSPKSALICSICGKYLLAGEEANPDFNTSVFQFLIDPGKHHRFYDLYASSDKWLETISELLAGHAARLKHCVYYYDLKSDKPYTQPQPLPQGFKLMMIDEPLFDKIVNEYDPNYKYHWGSARDFCSKNFGFCIENEGKIVSTGSSYYTGKGCAEIGIVTDKDFYRKGLAYAICTEFISHCKANGLTPLWVCDYGNEPSNSLAEKLGFTKVKDFEIFWWHQNREYIARYLEDFKYKKQISGT